MITEKEIEKSICAAESQLASCRRRMERVPEGNYRVRVRGGRLLLARFEGHGKARHEKYCSLQDRALLCGVIDKRYVPAVEAALTEELDLLYRLQDLRQKDAKCRAYEELPELIRAQISPLCVSSGEFCRAWESEPFYGNPVALPGGTDLLITDRGEQVRSRAELLIANLLNKLGLSYRYECAFSGGHQTYYPDFTIMHPETCELYYLEYFGLMDDLDYAARTAKKLNFYYATPQADHFIFLFGFRQAGLNLPAIENLLRRKFLE